MLGILSRHVVTSAVGVETGACADGAIYGVAQGVVHRKVDRMDMVTTSEVASDLCVESRIVVRHTAGVETGARADGAVDGIAECVVHSKVDNQIEETTGCGVAKILSINTLLCVWRIIMSANGAVAQMSVGVEAPSDTDNGIYGVAQGVVHR